LFPAQPVDALNATTSPNQTHRLNMTTPSLASTVVAILTAARGHKKSGCVIQRIRPILTATAYIS
jgi:hypothetical protein